MCKTQGAVLTFARSAASFVIAAEMSDEATFAPSCANGIDKDPTANKQGGSRTMQAHVTFGTSAERAKAMECAGTTFHSD